MALLIRFRRWIRLLCTVLGVIGAVVVVSMMLMVTADVFGRDAMNRPIFGSYELLELGMIVSVCTAFCVTQSNNFHVRIDVVAALLPRRWRGVLDSFTGLLLMAYVGSIAWQGWGQAMTVMARNASTTLLMIPKWPFNIWLVVGWSVFFLAVLADFLIALGTALGKGEEKVSVIPEEQLMV